ncbi:hypothetical protein LTR08_004825 [Meristemomyces frigidus]|nr:hypothetical protein LTR08_004825 [Meristemomyces frigidus]
MASSLASFTTAFPEELKVLIMDATPDFPTLYRFTLTSKDNKRIFETHPYETIEMVAKSMPKLIQDMTRKTFRIEHPVASRVALGGQLQWAVIALEEDVWLSTEGLDHYAKLAALAKTSHQVNELAKWVHTRQFNTNQHAYRLEKGGLTFDMIFNAVWQLAQYATTQSTIKTRVNPSGGQAAADHELRRTGAALKDGWLLKFDSIDLQIISAVLNILENGYGRLIRHSITPKSGTLLDLLFGRTGARGAGTSLLKLTARARWVALEPKTPAKSLAEAMANMKAMGAGDSSKFGVLNEEDVEGHGRRGGVSEWLSGLQAAYSPADN